MGRRIILSIFMLFASLANAQTPNTESENLNTKSAVAVNSAVSLCDYDDSCGLENKIYTRYKTQFVVPLGGVIGSGRDFIILEVGDDSDELTKYGVKLAVPIQEDAQLRDVKCVSDGICYILYSANEPKVSYLVEVNLSELVSDSEQDIVMPDKKYPHRYMHIVPSATLTIAGFYVNMNVLELTK